MRPAAASGGDPIEGLVIVDKPAGMTSHDVVARLRRLCGTRRVGHAGTLDPSATGVLVAGVGRATRLLGHLSLSDKEYEATIRLGEATVSDDAEGEVISSASAVGITEAAVRDVVSQSLTGALLQRPSSVSAVKVDGRRAYARVRAGEAVQLPPRHVTVHRLEVRASRRPAPHLLDVDVVAEVSSGTYVRALARDLGDLLGVGGHLIALRRTRVGPFSLASARTLEELQEQLDVMALAAAVSAFFPCWQVEASVADRVLHGARLPWPDGLPDTGPVGLFGPGGRVLSLARRQDDQAVSLVVFS
ncbi:MAG: tRNA pseudouridine(55) synthase TruB [Actinomycetota bacterium]|nr:MAG: tRNA pseudouridine(55) synthase TruB [Actinomycetota bacterium]